MIWLLLLFLIGAGALPFILEQRKPDMDDAARAKAPGQFAQLSDGQTHYQWHGPENGPVLVCIHGLTTPSFVWDQMMPGLTAAGFSVLTYDLFGRGWSDRPKGAQSRSFFLRQLRDLLQHEGLEGPFMLMGYSMGGAIASVFAAEEPDRVSQLILLAPAGIEHRPTRFDVIASRTGRFGLWLMLAFGGALLRRQAQAAASKMPADVTERLMAETGWRGYLPAVLSSQQNFLHESLEEEHRDLEALQVPIAAIWGETDTIIPMSAPEQLQDWNPAAKQAILPRASHALVVTHSAEVLESLADLL
jgi:pimeloyl-ACP methyl ester carboxylesterase